MKKAWVERWVAGAVLGVAVLLLRLPWMGSDGGNVGMWTYGTFLTDEGVYTSAGQLAYRTGRWVDPELHNPESFMVSWGMHFLAYAGYCVSGLTLGAIRWPVMVLAALGWVAAFELVSRRVPPLPAAALVFLISCNPVSLTYERIASTDVVVGALSAMAYAALTRRGVWSPWVGGVLVALGLSVKGTILGLAPLFVIGLFTGPRPRLRRLMGAVVSFAVVYAVMVGLREWCLRPLAVGGGAGNIRAELSKVPALKVLSWDPDMWARALSIFPRWPVNMELGVFVEWLILMPPIVVLLAWWRTGRIVTSRSAVALGASLFVAALSIQVQTPTRYFVALLYLVPCILVSARGLVVPWRCSRPVALGLPILLLGVLMLVYWWPSHVDPSLLGDRPYTVYDLPRINLWELLWPRLALGVAVVVVFFKWLRPPLEGWRGWCVLLLGAFLLVFLFFCNAPLQLGGKVKLWFAPQQILLQLAILVAWLPFFLGGRLRHWKAWYGIQLALLMGTMATNAVWLEAWGGLRGFRHQTRATSERIARAVPADAIIIGRQATTLLRNQALRVGLTSPDYEPRVFITKMLEILEKNPRQPLYWLVEDEGVNFQWMHYLKAGGDRFTVTTALTVDTASDLSPGPFKMHVLLVRKNPETTSPARARTL